MAESNNEGLIGRPRDHFQGRVSPFPSEIEGEQERETGHQKVWPGIELPLTAPCPLPVVREGKQVGNGPLIALGAPPADEISDKMQMEAQECQERRLPTLGRE